eukprot:12884065-Prorocentrum_lima.AAC.1
MSMHPATASSPYYHSTKLHASRYCRLPLMDRICYSPRPAHRATNASGRLADNPAAPGWNAPCHQD